jgi:23S rRNA (uracil1939-C5)-methyltransferase
VSLLERVQELPGLSDAVPVHRLDAGTSGAILFATSGAQASAWSDALAEPSAEKVYLALCRGISRDKGVVNRPLVERGKPKPARTRYRRLEVVGGHSLLEVHIDTGRTHQIRRHLAAIGHPILGDARHGHAPSNRHFEERHGLDRPFLHCTRLALGGLVAEAPLPGDLASVLASLRAGHTATR